MWRLIAAAVLLSALAGCVTSEGPYSRSAITSLESQRAAPAVASRPAKATQTAQAPRRRKIQVALRQRALGSLVHRAEYPIVVGTAF
jgi:hypothetical protein